MWKRGGFVKRIKRSHSRYITDKIKRIIRSAKLVRELGFKAINQISGNRTSAKIITSKEL